MFINWGRGAQSDPLLSTENIFYQDVNSTWLLYIRWLLLLNQVVWLFIGNGYTPLLEVAYFCSFIPSLSFILFENMISFCHTDTYALNSTCWLVTRSIIATLNSISIIMWGIYRYFNLILLGWVTTTFIIAIETIISCQLNDKCCNECKSKYRESMRFVVYDQL